METGTWMCFLRLIRMIRLPGMNRKEVLLFFQPNQREILKLLLICVDDNASALVTYGEINTWDVSLITDMSELFQDKLNFNSDISSWDVSNVTNMRQMFHNAQNFNSNISAWDVSNLTNMDRMFNL